MDIVSFKMFTYDSISFEINQPLFFIDADPGCQTFYRCVYSGTAYETIHAQMALFLIQERVFVIMPSESNATHNSINLNSAFITHYSIFRY